MKLAYQAFDRTGRAVTDTIEAADSHEATERLRRQGLYVTEIMPSDHAKASDAKATADRTPRHRLKNLAMFTRQLQVLVATGTPLLQGLMALERQARDATWQAIIGDVRAKVEEGSTLAEAMSEHPRCFDTIYRSLIAAGESGGNLDAMLNRLAALTRQQLKVRSSIAGTLTYPCLLLAVAVGVLGLMIGVLLPRFTGLYDTLDAALPPSTQVLLAISDFVRGYWWVIIGTALGGGIGAKIWLSSPTGRRALDNMVIRLPQFGRIVRSFITARIARVLGVLIESHVPLLEALALTREATGNSCYADLIDQAEEAVTKGENISSAFARSSLINSYVTEAIRNGEQTGQVAPLLLSIADFLDEENEVVIKSLTSIIEPIILIVLGLLVGLVALSMFMPLFDLTAMAGGGGA